MQSSIQLFSITIKEFFSYRLNFVLWRLRMVLGTLVTVFLWMAVFDGKSRFGYYSREQMLSYILFSSLITTLVSSTRTSELAAQIQDGSIMNLLLKPISVFSYYAALDVGDKCMNIFFGIIEFVGIVLLFHVPLVAPQAILLCLFFLACGIIISFFINLMLSFIGFWTPDVWAPRFLFTIIVFFVSGTYFPLDLLPEPIYRVLLLTPFPYLFFLPARILVGGAQAPYLIQQMICALFWTGGTYFAARLIWKKGITEFSFWGK